MFLETQVYDLPFPSPKCDINFWEKEHSLHLVFYSAFRHRPPIRWTFQKTVKVTEPTIHDIEFTSPQNAAGILHKTELV